MLANTNPWLLPLGAVKILVKFVLMDCKSGFCPIVPIRRSASTSAKKSFTTLWCTSAFKSAFFSVSKAFFKAFSSSIVFNLLTAFLNDSLMISNTLIPYKIFKLAMLPKINLKAIEYQRSLGISKPNSLKLVPSGALNLSPKISVSYECRNIRFARLLAYFSSPITP